MPKIAMKGSLLIIGSNGRFNGNYLQHDLKYNYEMLDSIMQIEDLIDH